MDVVGQVRQLSAAFDEFVVDVTVEEVTGRGEGAASAGEPAWHRSQIPALANTTPGRRLGLAAAAVLLVGGLLGALVWIDRGGTGPTDTAPADAVTEVASPLISLRSLLTNRSNDELFVVQANSASYWRSATFVRFDGMTWSFQEFALSRPDGEPAATPNNEEISQEIRIVDLGGKLVPAAPEQIAVSPGGALRWNADSSTLIKSDGDLVAGDVFEIASASPRFALEDFQAATSTAPEDPIYLELPDDFPSPVGELAREVTAGSTSSFESALALQDWFRNEFTYSLAVQPGHSVSAMEGFLRDRIGYAEQFAATYAAMMRSLGIPARVAVGFTPGVDGGESGYSVFGRNAHAWPEVWFDGLGWAPFEPTPGSGVPGAENSTDVDP